MGNNFTVVKLSDITVKITKGTTPSKNDGGFAENGVNYIKAESVSYDGRINESTFAFIDESVHEKLKRSQLEENDILFSMAGAYLGKTGFVKKEHLPANTNQALALIRVNENIANPKFIHYYLQQNSIIHFVNNSISQSAQPNINLQQIGDLNIILPHHSEQTKVVGFMSCLDNKITFNRQINQTLEQMAQALFKSWFVDFDPVVDNALDAGFFEQDLAFPDELLRRAEARRTVREHGDFKPLPDATRQLFPAAFEECAEPSVGLGGWVPKGWKYESFGQLLSMSIGGDWGKDSPDESHSVQSRIVRGTDIPDLMSGQLSKAPLRWVEPKKLKSRQIEAGDIIIEVSGGSPTQSTGRSIFMSDLMLQRLGEVVEPASFCRRFKPKSINHGLLGFLHLQKIYADGKMWEYQNQSTGIANFQTKFFLEAEPVLIPSNDLLDEFCKRVKPLVDKSHSNEQIVLTNLRDTLLPKLISGELRLDNIEADFAKEGVA